MAWNTYRHMECWYAIMGLGAVCHTLNPRLFAEQLVYIAGHASDRVLLVDRDLAAIAAKILPALDRKILRHVIVMTDQAHMAGLDPQLGFLCYEALLAAEALPPAFAWAPVGEDDACGLCYTSGTTGPPKGVLYSHRSNVLHSLMVCLPDGIGLSASDTVCAVVPLFHANSWGLAFSALIAGARLVLPGPKLDGPSVHRLLEEQGVTITAAVPTVWLALLQHLEATNGRLTSLKRVVIGGAAVPRAMLEAFESKHGVEVRHAWGMTELSPLGSINAPKGGAAPPLEGQALLTRKLKQGRAPYMVELAIKDDAGAEQMRDGQSVGRLMARGPFTLAAYFRSPPGAPPPLDGEGYFDTGDVASIDEDGYMAITDRSKDVIKSGGEWISSMELENAAMGHPRVGEAAVIGIPHDKWGERPLLIVAPRPGGAVPSKQSLLEHLRPLVAAWWLPDDVAYIGEIPHTATGKIDKKELRKRFILQPAASKL